MADASCGPSNAFKGLARHIEQDRSHQQDRVGPGHQQPAQNFRSTPLNSNSTQFQAFFQQDAALPQHPVAGLDPLPATYQASRHGIGPAHPSQALNPYPPQVPQQLAHPSTTAGGSWVSDFQRMGLNAEAGPLNHQHQNQFHAEPQLRNGISSPFPQPFLSSRSFQPFQPFQPGPAGMHGFDGRFENPQAATNLASNEFLSTKAQEDLEKEFDQAMDEWMAQNGPQSELLNQEGAQTLDEADTTQENETEAPIANSDTELARAAQQLVDSVSDNDSDKFKNSKFLEFMRRLASQELTVRDNELVPAPQAETSSDDLAGQIGSKQTHA
ncbi:hypothetical protein GGS20DRAFT_550364 [Poronia punctata]|nr:hypothetical protein GGS20DRAFT_550364 [Poronia punctata]